MQFLETFFIAFVFVGSFFLVDCKKSIAELFLFRFIALSPILANLQLRSDEIISLLYFIRLLLASFLTFEGKSITVAPSNDLLLCFENFMTRT